MTGSRLLVVRSEPKSAEDLDRYLTWYGHHMRELLEIPGVSSARRFVSEEGELSYMSMYEIDSPDVFQLPEYRRVRSTFRDLMSAVDFTRNVYREVDF